MIPAEKSAAIGRVFATINRRMIRRHFHAVHVRGAENILDLDRSCPIILYGNHSNWWDGLLEFYFSADLFHLDAYLMMEERQMARYRFFRWIGAFSVAPESPRSAVESIRYAAGLFDRPNRALWIYPQGIMRPNDARPLAFFRGTARIVQLLGSAQMVPVAHRFEFLKEQRPEVFTVFGESETVNAPFDPKELTERLERRTVALLDDLRCCVSSEYLGLFTTVLTGRLSTNVLYDLVR
jgi:hypothetical protein